MEMVRIALGNRGAGTAPVFATLEGGYFREQGLDVELVPHDGHAKSLATLAGGGADFANAVAPEVISANLRNNSDLVIVASAISRSAQQFSARPGLTTRDDLRGKRWGVQMRNDADEVSINMAFERWGWDPAKDAKIVVVGFDGARLDLLLDKENVDVAVMHAPEPFIAEKRGWNLVYDLGRMDISFQNSCAVTTRRFAREHKPTVLRYVRAYSQGVHRFRTDAAFGVEVLRKHTGQSELDILESSWVMFARLMGGMMFPSLEGVRNASYLLHRLGAIPHAIAPEEVVDQGPVAELEREGFFRTLFGLPPRQEHAP
jgi:ABC-type nitrate/sulfonate/bicarbonate transport system substrate-binding protein